MSSRMIVAVLAIVLVAVFLSGCTDKTKENPTRPFVENKGLVFTESYHFFTIFFSTMRDPGFMPAMVYTPPGYDYQGGTGPSYPVLYLLAPFRADERYYFEHGLAQVADRLISEGKIKPMIIVTIDGQSQLGGSFFKDSPTQGKFLTALTRDTSIDVSLYIDPLVWPAGYRGTAVLGCEALITRIDSRYLTLVDKEARGISGVGMGGYGAFATVLESDQFGSVSAIDAPLDFDGTGNNGFLSLFDKVFPPGSPWSRIDTTLTGRIDTIFTVDTALADPLKSLVVSAAAAFSPNVIRFEIDSVYRDQFNVQTFGFHVDSILDADRIAYLPRHNVHVPFDSLGNLHSSIWDLWLAGSIPSLYEAAPSNIRSDFADMNKLLVKSNDSTYFFNEQMDGIIQYFSGQSIPFDTLTFKGTEQLPPSADHYLYDLLEDILIFHSNNFVVPDAK
jgi:hypothetical protein